MVGTIRPIVYRNRQLLRWGIAATLHLLGNITGAIVVGFVLGLLGYWLIPYSEDRWRLLFSALGTFSIVYALDEMKIIHLPHPQRLKQVPASWRALFHPYISAFLYGGGLGAGIVTRIATSLLYVVLFGLLLYAHPAYAAITFSLFGLGRGGGVFVIGWVIRNLYSGEEFALALQRLVDQQDRIHALTGVILAIFGGYWGMGLYFTLL